MEMCLECFAEYTLKYGLVCAVCNNVVEFDSEDNNYSFLSCFMGCHQHMCDECGIGDEHCKFKLCPVCANNIETVKNKMHNYNHKKQHIIFNYF